MSHQLDTAGKSNLTLLVRETLVNKKEEEKEKAAILDQKDASYQLQLVLRGGVGLYTEQGAFTCRQDWAAHQVINSCLIDLCGFLHAAHY